MKHSTAWKVEVWCPEFGECIEITHADTREEALGIADREFLSEDVERCEAMDGLKDTSINLLYSGVVDSVPCAGGCDSYIFCSLRHCYKQGHLECYCGDEAWLEDREIKDDQGNTLAVVSEMKGHDYDGPIVDWHGDVWCCRTCRGDVLATAQSQVRDQA